MSRDRYTVRYVNKVHGLKRLEYEMLSNWGCQTKDVKESVVAVDVAVDVVAVAVEHEFAQRMSIFS